MAFREDIYATPAAEKTEETSVGCGLAEKRQSRKEAKEIIWGKSAANQADLWRAESSAGHRFEADSRNINQGEAATEAIRDLDKILAHSGERLIAFGGGSEAGGTASKPISSEDYIDAADFFAGKSAEAKLAELSEKARRLYDSPLSQTEKNRIFREIGSLREQIRRLTGGTLVYDPSGDWNVKMPDNETINIFHSHNSDS
ncbi:MAG TPA: hypothetical protein VMC41_02390 [Candidatus Nanoarchaeia archaeon]|nr:hypothetical protein [Candidatus Nanoarchaeia archaeon]